MIFRKKKHVFFIFILVYPRVYYCFFLKKILFVYSVFMAFYSFIGPVIVFLNVVSYFFNRFYGDISWDTDQQSDIWVCLTCGILYTLRK